MINIEEQKTSVTKFSVLQGVESAIISRVIRRISLIVPMVGV